MLQNEEIAAADVAGGGNGQTSLGTSIAFRLFVWIAPLLYLGFALVTPPFQTPDEHQHLFRAWQLASGHLLGQRHGTESGGELPPALARAAAHELGSAVPHADRPLTKTGLAARFSYETAIVPEELPRFTNFLGSVSYSPAGYVPQMIAVGFGRGFGLSVETTVRMGRIFNALLTFLLFCGAFRSLPLGRIALLVVGLHPMTAACAGSFGQDGLILGGTAWLVALSAQAICLGRWTRANAAVFVLVAMAVTLAKMVYLPLAAMSLLSRRLRGTSLNWLVMPALAGFIAAISLGLWLYLNTGLSVPMDEGMPLPGAQLQYLWGHPAEFAGAFARTYAGWPLFLGQMFTFGWLNVGPVMPAFYLTLAAFAVAIWHGDPSSQILGCADRAWTLFLLFFIVVVLSIALYLAGSPLAAGSIFGLQGRYFLPLVLPLALICMSKRSLNIATTVATSAVVTLMVLANLVALGYIAQAYYS